MNTWYEKAEAEIEQELIDGHITQKEYNQAIRELRWEMESIAQEAADNAYHDAMGYY